MSGRYISPVSVNYYLLTLNIVSFVDQDIIMWYFGGKIGHLKNTPPQQVSGYDPIDPSPEEMSVKEEGNIEDNEDDPCSSTNEDLSAIGQQLSRDIIINDGELEVSGDNKNKDHDDDKDSDDSNEGEGEGDESGCSGDEEEEGEDGYGYSGSKNCPNDGTFYFAYYSVNSHLNHTIPLLVESQAIILCIIFSDYYIMYWICFRSFFPKLSNIGTVF